MKTGKLLLVLSALFLFAYTDSYAKKEKKSKGGEYDVYLLIGQSNMAGRGTMTAEDQQPIEGVWLLNDKGEPVPATNPLNQYSSVRKGLSVQQIGPGYSFGKTIAAKTGRKVLLVVNALGGSNIYAWKKSADFVKDKQSIAFEEKQLFAEAVRRVKQAQKYGELKGILWHQGEGNHGDVYYTSTLANIMKDMRAALDAPDAVVVVGQIAQWVDRYKDFNERIKKIAEKLPNSDWVSSEGVGMLKDKSDVHFSREGQILLGERYAEKILQMCYPDKK